MTALEWIASTSILNPVAKALGKPMHDGGRQWPANRIECADGESISVQAGGHTYCTPRIDQSPWTAFECGFPSVAPPESMMEYCEDPTDPTNTVYGFVPIDVVKEYIDAHGGERDGMSDDIKLKPKAATT